MKKITFVCMLFTILFSSISANAMSKEKIKYYKDLEVNDWIFDNDKSNKSWYYFKDGDMLKDSWLDNKYYFKSDGSMAIGWTKINNDWYLFSKSGTIKTGWIEDNSKWYYLDSNGIMLHDTTTPDGYKIGLDGTWVK